MPVFTLTQQIPPRPQGGTEAQMGEIGASPHNVQNGMLSFIFIDVCCLIASPPLSVTNHPSLPQPSLELAVVQRVTHSPPRLLTQGNIVELAVAYIPVVKIKHFQQFVYTFCQHSMFMEVNRLREHVQE